jgi:NADH:ubiquinone oxidoreductase subunit 4 (subunit M)
VLVPIAVLILAMGVYPSVFLSRSNQAIQTIKARLSPVSEVAAGTEAVTEER